jgi:hypothetical protein
MTRNSRPLTRHPGTATEAKTIAIVSDYDYTWAVFDVEAAGPYAQRHHSLQAAVARAEQAGISCAISHPCFELWLILHHRLHTSYLSNENARSAARSLPYDYDDKGFAFDKLWPHRGTALHNAEQLDRQQRQDHPSLVDRNPWTSVHELVRQLLVITGEADSGEITRAQQRPGPPSGAESDKTRKRRRGDR